MFLQVQIIFFQGPDFFFKINIVVAKSPEIPENVSDDFDLICHGQTIIFFENYLKHPFISINLNYVPDWGPFTSINLNCVPDAPSLPSF